MKLLQTEVSEDTYDLLTQLGTYPRRREIRETIRNYKETFSWIVDKKEEEKIELAALSGEADPRIWNALEEEIMAALGEGMKYIHCIGPLLCTDENGRNAILEAYREYPKDVDIYLSRIRRPYHWTCFSRKTDGESDLFFQLHGECYHEPLAAVRKGYSVCLERQDDKYLSEKVVYWHNRQRDYLWVLPIMDKVVDADQVPTLSLSQMAASYKAMAARGLNFNLSTAKEIVRFS
jgi:hypothetical protein